MGRLNQELARRNARKSSAFTIVELLIVVVVIAILAAITIVSYNGIASQAKDSALKSNLSQAAKKFELHKTKNGTYPSTANATTPAPSTSISVCPAGWRLPTGEIATGEFALLNNAINSGLTDSDAGLRSNWLAQLGGHWYNGFGGQGSPGHYWSASQNYTTDARTLYFDSSYVYPASNVLKSDVRSVRCLAS